MPGTQEEMTRFQEDTVSSSKVHVECTFPRLDVNLHTKDVFENIYNRLVRRNGRFIKSSCIEKHIDNSIRSLPCALIEL